MAERQGKPLKLQFTKEFVKQPDRETRSYEKKKQHQNSVKADKMEKFRRLYCHPSLS
jgi:hypothetical protein